MITKKKVFLIVGRTGVGKSALSREVCNRLGLNQLKSYTTRPARKEETENPDESDHLFITPGQVYDYRDDLAAYTVINDNAYFTTKTMLRDSDLYVIDPNGVEGLLKECADEFDFVVIYIRAPKDLMRERFIKRGGTKEQFEQRWSSEGEQFTAFEKYMRWSYHIMNDRTFNEAADKLEKFVRRELNL